MADKITFSTILAEKLKQDPGFISSEVIWPEMLKALSYMLELNKIQDSEPTTLAFYDGDGDLWQISKCGTLVSKKNGALQFKLQNLLE